MNFLHKTWKMEAAEERKEHEIKCSVGEEAQSVAALAHNYVKNKSYLV